MCSTLQSVLLVELVKDPVQIYIILYFTLGATEKKVHKYSLLIYSLIYKVSKKYSNSRNALSRKMFYSQDTGEIIYYLDPADYFKANLIFFKSKIPILILEMQGKKIVHSDLQITFKAMVNFTIR